MLSLNDIDNIHKKEVKFHDSWAHSVQTNDISVREAFELPTAPENQFILSRMGPLMGKRLLDVGIGLGESSVYFALKGAHVTAVDISPSMVNLAIRLGQLYGVQINAIVSTAESLDLPENHFDFAYLGNLIHHVANREKLFEQIHQVLRPGGKFFSWDPLAYNPVINVYRRVASKMRTEDERPLTFHDVALARKYFNNVGHREFWISSLILFLKYYFIDKIDPNEDRYWKRILKETPSSLRWWMPFRILDEVLTRLPFIHRFAWNIVIWGEKIS